MSLDQHPFQHQTRRQGVHIRIKGRGDTPPLHISWNRFVWGPRGQAARIYSRLTRFCGLEYIQTMWRSYLINSEHHYKQQPSEYILNVVSSVGVESGHQARRLGDCSYEETAVHPLIHLRTARGTDVSQGLTDTSAQRPIIYHRY